MTKENVIRLLKNQTCEHCHFRLYRKDLQCSFRVQLPENQTCDKFVINSQSWSLGISSRGYGNIITSLHDD
jgi:hypothetical protein